MYIKYIGVGVGGGGEGGGAEGLTNFPKNLFKPRRPNNQLFHDTATYSKMISLTLPLILVSYLKLDCGSILRWYSQNIQSTKGVNIRNDNSKNNIHK